MISKMILSDLVGLGESSHGTREYQLVRLDIIKYLHDISAIQVFIEADYPSIERLKVPEISKQKYISNVKQSTLFHHLKSDSFCDILWYLQRNNVPYYGVDVQIRPKEPDINPVVTWIKNYSGNRTNGMHQLIHLLWDPSTRGIFLAHNYHISGYTNFSGTKIGFATGFGTVTQYNPESDQFQITQFDYPDQELQYDTFTITKTNKWFYNTGESVDSNHQIMSGNKFDYIIFVPETHAL